MERETREWEQTAAILARFLAEEKSVEVGQQVTPGTNLVRVADPSHLKATVRIPETQAKDVAIGQKATIDTHNGTAGGYVTRVDAAVVNGTVAVDVSFDAEMGSIVRATTFPGSAFASIASRRASGS